MCRLNCWIVFGYLMMGSQLRAARLDGMEAYRSENDLGPLLHAKGIRNVFRDTDVDIRLTAFHILGHILGDEDIAIGGIVVIRWGGSIVFATSVVVRGGLAQAPIAYKSLSRVSLQGGNAHQGAWPDIRAQAIEVEQDFVL